MISASLAEILTCLPRRLSAEMIGMSESYSDFERGLCEIRLRHARASSIVFRGRNIFLSSVLTAKELSESFRALSRGSLYAFADSLREGYLTFGRGYRVGVAGRAVSTENTLVDVGSIASLCIRIPHAVDGAGDAVVSAFRSSGERSGVLVLSPPGVGKTTALRDAARQLSSGARPLRTVIIDSRGELGSEWFPIGCMADVLVGYPKAEGISIAIRTLSPEVIVCDEIGDEKEVSALLEVQRCGVPIIASVHASEIDDVLCRPAISRLIKSGAFGVFIGIKRKSENIYEYETVSLDDLIKKTSDRGCSYA